MEEKTEEISFKNCRLVGESGLHDVLVSGRHVVAISKTGDIQRSHRVDVKGRWLAPGLIDYHVHSKLAAHHSHRLDLQSAKSAKEALLKVTAALSDSKFDRPELVGINMRNGDWPDNAIMSRRTLDAVSSTRPIYLLYNGYHSMVVNSVGLQRIGLRSDTGILLEEEAFKASKMISQVDDRTMDRWIDAEAEKAASLGVTLIVDLEMDFNIRDWQRRCRNGFRTLRVEVGLYDEHFDDAIRLGVKTGSVIPDTNGLIAVGPYKIVTDGSLGSQTAYCHDPYPNTENYGLLAYPPRTLREVTQKATDAGFRLAVHAIGDHANHLVLKTLSTNPHPPLPGSSVEHAQLLDMKDIDYFRSLDLVASVQPRHLVDDRETCLRYWPGRDGRAWALKSLRDAGVKMKFGSDCPVADMSPFEAMAVAISRSGQGGLTLSEEQAVDVETAWVSTTWSGAKSIRIGDRADFVVLDADPLTCDASQLRRIKIVATMVDGRFTYGEL